MALQIGEKIRGLRDTKGLSQERFARRFHVNRSTVDHWEDRHSDPSAARLKQIAAELEVRVGYFFDEIGELSGLGYSQVAARESLRLLLLELDIPESKHKSHRLWRAVDAPDAPVTREGWKARTAFVRALSGEK